MNQSGNPSADGAYVRVWDLPVRVFHWSLAISFAAAYLLAEEDGLRQWHVMFGYTVLGLIAFRLLWGAVGTRYARFPAMLFSPRAALNYFVSIARGKPQSHVGHNPAGSYAVFAMLFLGIATGVSGYLMLSEVGGESLEEVHEVLANAWLAVVVVHIAGVIFSSLTHHQNLARAMITGHKRLASGQPQTTSSPRNVVGLLLVVTILGYWIACFLTGGPALGNSASEARGPQGVSTLAHDRQPDDD